MRKTGLSRSRSRRKGAQNGPGTPVVPNDAPLAPPLPNGGPGANAASGEGRRKPTQDEAALTAKNYRLAKELSELRVRHRDETKAVTRLTMENMNLASRCREAMSHVAMLKKELAMHQRRAAEALALQRQQTQRMSDHTSDEMDRIPASGSPPPPPPPPPKELKTQLTLRTPQDNQYPFDSPAGLSGSNEEVRAAAASGSQGQSRTLPVSQRPDFDAVSHDLGVMRKSHKMGSAFIGKHGAFGDDVPVDEMMLDRDSSGFGTNNSMDLFAGKSALPVTPEKESFEDKSVPSFGNLADGETRPAETPTSVNSRGEGRDGAVSDVKSKSPAFPTPVVKNRPGSMSSIDAFEASFDTTFPASFSTQSEEPPPSLDIAFDVPEFSDPFFLGSMDSGERNNSSPFLQSGTVNTTTGQENETTRFGRLSAGAVACAGAGLHSSGVGEAAGNSSESAVFASPSASVNSAASKLPSFDLFPSSAMGAFETDFSEHRVGSTPNKSSSGNSFFSTPPVDPSSFGGSSMEVPPAPKEKTGAVEARARYDAALGEASSSGGKPGEQKQSKQHVAGGDSISIGSRSETGNNPSLVLKRLQHRRAREKGSATSPPSGGGQQSPDSNAISVSGGDSENSESHRASLVNGDYGPRLRKGSSNSPDGDSSAALKPGSVSGRGPSGKQRVDASRGRVGSGGKLSPDAMGEEMRQLDAIASAASDASSGQAPEAPSAPPTAVPSSGPLSSRRRNAKQPISYAEPPLNTKLRRGDVFFPRKDSSSELEPKNTVDENGAVKVVQVEPSLPESSGSQIDLNPVQSTSAEDVLKDLAGKSTALKL